MGWKIREAEFLRAIERPEAAPPPRPAVAFAGRSNVGKSSLLNRLVGGRKLARTSATPGCTRQIVYYLIDGRYHFIDLPGYGYARVPRGEHARWGAMMDRFIRREAALRAVVVLADVRRDPDELDRRLIEWLRAHGRPWLLVVTKCDKVGRGERARRLEELRAAWEVPAEEPPAAVSARTGEGIPELAARLRALLERPSEA